MIKKYCLLFALSAIAFSVNSQTKPAAKKPAPKPAVTPAKTFQSSLDSASYAFGLSIAQDLKARGTKSLNYNQLSKAMSDVFQGNKTAMTMEEAQQVISNFLNAISRQKFEGAIAEGKKFLAENKQKQGVVTLASGLQYQVLRDGNGPKPSINDEVTVHYKGTLLNGIQFDSSYDRNEPVTLLLTQVIPGWTEGLQQMPLGSKFRFFIPWQLAYGEQAAGEIPPYSVLVFEIELLKIGQ
ncbi:MAG TPA: FKBP-type peptidyl-prolyl cis-trans isomerase [Daejeonella sp.]|nr:FKBP-type peptidyl-prolyl cis-trans isomerase [Daejeonella sp.]